jgi:hypothetical protein
VGSIPGEDEDASASVRCPNVGGCNSDPRRVIPEVGKVPKHGTHRAEEDGSGCVVPHVSVIGSHVIPGEIGGGFGIGALLVLVDESLKLGQYCGVGRVGGVALE